MIKFICDLEIQFCNLISCRTVLEFSNPVIFYNFQQINEHYLFAGSFALNCYHYADSEIEIMNRKNEKEFIVQNVAKISDYNKKILAERVRPVGDMDIVFFKRWQISFNLILIFRITRNYFQKRK